MQADYEYPECPYCASEIEIDDLQPTYAWQACRCPECGRGFELRMTQQARFEIRQLNEAEVS